MKSDNPKVGGKHFNVPERSEIVPRPGDLQNHKFWAVFMAQKCSKKKIIHEIDFYMFFVQNFALISFF